MKRVERYADGDSVDFSEKDVDLRLTPAFHQRCYRLLLGFGWGQTTTYGDMARALGDATLARAVGQAMGANPVPLLVPCHRVLASGNRAGGFSAAGGVDAKRRLLALEGRSFGVPADQMSFGF